MPITSRVVAATDEPERIDGTDDQNDSISGQSIAVLNDGSDIVYLGGDDVTDTTGFPLSPGAQIAFDLAIGDALYGVCADGDSTSLRLLETGV